MKTFYKGEDLYYLEDGIDKFSIIYTYPELPYEELSDTDLDRYWKFLEWHLSSTSPSFQIWFKSREELYEVYVYLSKLGYHNMKVRDICSDDYDLDIPGNRAGKLWQRKVIFDINSVKNPSLPWYGRRDWSIEDRFCAFSSPTWVTLEIRITRAEFRKFISEIKDLKRLSYKNAWMFPGRKLWDDYRTNKKILIA